MTNNDQGINWEDYIDCIFVISIDYTNSSSTILGTFFSKNYFVIDNDNNTIKGTDIIYKQKTDQEKYIDGDTSNIPTGSTIFFVKTSKEIKKNFTSDDAIYKLIGYSSIQIENNKDEITGITKIQKVNNFNPPSSLTGTQITTIDDATINSRSNNLLTKLKSIKESLDKLTSIKDLLNPSQIMTGGAPDKDNFKKVIDYFQEFVNIFITDSIIFQINSLNAEQINKLFDNEFNDITINKFNDITINDNPVIYNRNDIKPILFDHIYSNCYDKYVNLDVVVSNEEHLPRYATDPAINDIATKFYLFTENTTMFNKIKNDTDIFNNIFNKIIPNTGSNTGSQKIHLYYVANSFQNFYTNHYSAIVNTRYFNGIIDNIYNIINDITDNFTKKIIITSSTQTITSSTQTITMIDIIKSLHDAKNDDFRIELSNYLKENASNKIITYLKINNFEKEQYNQRFNILIKDTLGETDTKKQNAMIVEYNDHNFPYYIKNNGSIVLNETELNKNTDFQINSQTKQLTVNKYKNEYFFGNYSQIFKPDLSNEKIAEQMDVIINQIDSGKPVFMLGYGASGSGKTSSLIYFNKGKDQEKEGILIHLCKKLKDRGYDKIEVTAKEYFIVNKENGSQPYCQGNNQLDDPIVCQDSDPYLFTYDNSKSTFTLNENTNHIHTTKHKYRFPNDNSETKTFEKGESIGNVMIYLIDQDRFVKATTNNPQSSRSHSMVYLKLTKTNANTNAKTNANTNAKTNANDIGYIIIGDYAGVENKFTCENASTIMDFLEKKRDCDNINKNECTPYYSNEFMIDNNDDKKHDTFHDENYGFIYDEKVDEKDGVEKVGVEKVGDKKVGDKKVDDEKVGVEKVGDKKVDDEKDGFEKDGFENKSFRTMIDDFVKKNQNNQVINILYNICIMEENKKYEKYGIYNNNEKHGNIVDIFHNFLRNDTTLLTKFHKNMETFFKKIHNINSTTINDLNIFKDINKKLGEINKKRRGGTKKKTPKKNTSKIEMLTKLLTKVDDLNTLEKLKTRIIDITNSTQLNNITNSEYLTINQDQNQDFKISYDPSKDEEFIDYFHKYKAKEIHDASIIAIYKSVHSVSVIHNTVIPNTVDKSVRNIFKNIFTENDEIKPIYVNTSKQLTTNTNNTKMKPIDVKNYRTAVQDHFEKDLNAKISEINNKNENNKNNHILSFFTNGNYVEINYTQLKQKYDSIMKGVTILNSIKNSFLENLFPNENYTIEEIKKIMELFLKDFLNIINFINDIYKRLDYGKIICSNRVFEGEFINKSLQDIRNTIKDIITVKSEGIVFNSPDYIDICLKQYCPTHTDCFKTPSLKEKYDNIDSVLIRSIYEYLKKDQEKEYTVKDFYKDILVSVFCVFNISREANNPPSVPYIDINLLKIHMAIYEKTKEESVKNETMEKIKSELDRLYYKLNHGKKVQDDTTTYTDETTFEQNQVSVILNSDEYNKIYTKTNYEISNLKKFIETIDNNNAISAIGTLEFLDQIAKYNTANTICSRLDALSLHALSPEAIQNYKDTRRFGDLYQKIQ